MLFLASSLHLLPTSVAAHYFPLPVFAYTCHVLLLATHFSPQLLIYFLLLSRTTSRKPPILYFLTISIRTNSDPHRKCLCSQFITGPDDSRIGVGLEPCAFRNGFYDSRCLKIGRQLIYCFLIMHMWATTLTGAIDPKWGAFVILCVWYVLNKTNPSHRKRFALSMLIKKSPIYTKNKLRRYAKITSSSFTAQWGWASIVIYE